MARGVARSFCKMTELSRRCAQAGGGSWPGRWHTGGRRLGRRCVDTAAGNLRREEEGETVGV
jgi:hypothetical protein